MKNEVRPIDANALERKIREYMRSLPASTARIMEYHKVLSMLGDEGQTPTLQPTCNIVATGEPLTLEQLRWMDDHPVKVKNLKYAESRLNTGVVTMYDPNDSDNGVYVGCAFFCIKDYGKGWIAYTYPPAHIGRGIWMNASERMPEDGQVVLVTVSGKPQSNITLEYAYELAEWSIEEGWILNCWPEWKGAKVTHWMPLPEPPTELEKRVRG